MKVALFVPCYIDAFFPEVGIATLELLERLGIEVVYPLDQTCCGQPMANSGCHDDAAATEALFVRNFAGYDYIVGALGQLRPPRARPPDGDRADAAGARRCARSTYELVEFLHDVLEVREFPWAEFPHKVGLHNGCATLRALREAKTSEIAEPHFSKPLGLLSKVKGIEFVTAAAARRMLRLRRHVLGVRGAGVGANGLRQGQRPPSRRRRVHRLGRHVVHDAPAGLRRAARAADQVHPHRAGAERSAQSMKPHRPRRGVARSSSRRRTTSNSTTSACGTCARSATAKARQLAEWEELRSLASAIKEHTLTHLADYLEEFERNATATACTCTGRATPPSTTRSSSTS